MSKNFTKNLPPRFVRNIVGVCREKGALRLDDLPRIIGAISKKWAFAQMVLSAWWSFEESAENWKTDLALAEIWDV